MHGAKVCRVAVIYGGPSSEAAVSERSARGVSQALLCAGHEPQLISLDSELPRRLVEGAFDVAFPVAHGPLGEDGCLQGMLEVLSIPYVGSDVRASAIAAHKPTAKALFERRGVPVASGLVLHRGEPVLTTRIRELLGSKVVVKPASGGSAIGVTRITDGQDNFDEALLAAVALAAETDSDIVVEAFREGLEVTCGVIDSEDGPIAFPPTLIRPKAAAWYDFVSRYQEQASDHECPAPIGEALTVRVQELAVLAHLAVGARDLSRSDLVVGKSPEEVVVLEVNTLPGMTNTSNYPEAALVYGMSFPELCERLIGRALKRPARTRPQVIAIPESPFPS